MRSFPQRVVLQMLRAYKWAISPMIPPSCRYVPTCSEYATEAVERHGAIRGGFMALLRLLRCHPFVKGGFDPVPLREGDDGCDEIAAPILNGRERVSFAAETQLLEN